MKTKKILSVILTLAMLLSLIPTGFIVSAADPDPIVFTKDLLDSAAGQPKRIKLEAYTTGSTSFTETTMPADIVLVLDQSGSMDDTIDGQTKLDIMKSAVTTFAQEVARFNTQNNDAYRLAIVGFASESGNGDNTEILTVYGTEEITNIEYRRVDDITTLDTSKTYYIADGDGYTSISYYEASSSIFGSYQAGWYTSGFFAFRGDYVNIQSTTVYERITTTTSAAATTPGIPYNSLETANYQAALVNCTADSILSTGTIGKAIAELDASGATRTDLGMQMAASIFASQPAGTYTNRQKIVVVITDGVPTTQSDFSATVANNAVTSAKEMKDGGAHVFSMYLGTPSGDSVNFLQALSSNYPDATSYTSLGTAVASSYYSAHTDASAVTNVFEDIAFSITSNSSLNEQAVVTDAISAYFRLPETTGSYDTEQIAVYTVDKTAGGWDTIEKPFDMATVTIESGKTIKVTGFNFAYHCVTTVAKDGASDYGRKLVIYIPIVEDENADTFGGYLPTNDGAGIFETADAATAVITAPGKHDDATLKYSLLDTEVWEHIGTGTSYTFAYDAATLNPLLDEMVPASSMPNGSRNAGVSMTYSLIDTNMSAGVQNDDTIIATLTVGAGETVDVTDFANWTLADPANTEKVLSIPTGTNNAEAMYVLACRLTSTNPSAVAPYDTLLEYSLLDIEIVNESVHLVGGVIDDGGSLTVDPSAPGTLLANTYREAVAEHGNSAEMTFAANTGYEISEIIVKTSSSHDTPLDISTVIYDITDPSNSDPSIFELDGTYKFQAIDVTSGTAVEVYTRLKEFTLTTQDDAGSNIMDGRTYTYSTEPLEVFFTAHTGYKITSVEVDGITYTDAQLLAKSVAELESIGITIETDLDHNGDTIIVDGDVHVSRTEDHDVKVTSAKRSYNLTYKYYQQTSGGYTELTPDGPSAIEFGEALAAPTYNPGDETTIGSDTYTLRGWYAEHVTNEFYDLTDLSAITMPAHDLVFHAFWEKNPNVVVNLGTVTKNIKNYTGADASYGSAVTFTFKAVFNEHEVGTATVTLGATDSTASTTISATLTDFQYDQFVAGRPIYLYEVHNSADVTLIYDDTRYAVYYDGTIKNAATNQDAAGLVFENRLAPYLVNYDLAGGNIGGNETIAPRIVGYTEANLLPTGDAVKAGYEFAGWKKDTVDVDNTKTYSELAGAADVTAITLVAEWTPKNYTVHYDLAGGTLGGNPTIADATVRWDDANLIPAGTPAKASYTFTGWKKDTVDVDNTKTYAELAGVPTVMEITLVAEWSYAGGGGGGGGGSASYVLTYETNGGNNIPSEKYNAGRTVEITKVPEKEGYIFDGWHIDKELTESVDTVKMVKNITVYADWIKDNGNAGNGHETPGSLNGDDHFAYVVGYPDGTVRPNANIDRAEVAAIFFRLLKQDVRDKNLTNSNSFADVNEEDWHNTAISTMAKLGIVNGRYEGIFEPDAFITRAEFAAICARFDDSEYEIVDTFTDVKGHWAEAEIHEAAAHGWIKGYEDNTFKPDQFISRAEAFTMINRVLNRIPETTTDLHSDMVKWPDNANTSSWFYIAVQEATNSHKYNMKNRIYEKWTSVEKSTDWTQYQ